MVDGVLHVVTSQMPTREHLMDESTSWPVWQPIVAVHWVSAGLDAVVLREHLNQVISLFG